MGARGKQSAAVAGKVETPKTNYLKVPPKQSKEFCKRWRQIVKDWPPGFFMVSDGAILAEYINNELEIVEARLYRQEHGLFYTQANGAQCPNPAIKLINDLQKTNMALARQLRIAPSGRDSLIKRGTLKETHKPTTTGNVRPMFKNVNGK